uniref:Uncharacterized protein n=1 Tax=Oryza meridionalis TaxID=40149 RepID=A0A0E0EG65_9ORYZ
MEGREAVRFPRRRRSAGWEGGQHAHTRRGGCLDVRASGGVGPGGSERRDEPGERDGVLRARSKWAQGLFWWGPVVQRGYRYRCEVCVCPVQSKSEVTRRRRRRRQFGEPADAAWVCSNWEAPAAGAGAAGGAAEVAVRHHRALPTGAPTKDSGLLSAWELEQDSIKGSHSTVSCMAQISDVIENEEGQSFGCFLTPGILCKLREANDYVGKHHGKRNNPGYL